MDRLHHSINLAAKRSGLSAHVIRVWEKRYGVVAPARTESNRRLYSDSDIERLTLLRMAVGAGYRIGNIARLPPEELRSLTASEAAEGQGAGAQAGLPAAREGDFVQMSLQLIRRMDASALEEVLTRALIGLGHQGLLRKVIAPVTTAIGDLWQEGTLTAGHEHFASAFLRQFLSHGSRSFGLTESAPALVVATPSGQMHELGAVMITSVARNLGWRVIYLGCNLPAAEIAGAAVQNRARAVALSLVYPMDDAEIPRELAALRRYLPAGVALVAGGRAMPAYREALNRVGAMQTEDMDEFARQLEALRGQGTTEVSAAT